MRLGSYLLIASLAASAPLSVLAAGSPESGKAIAERWCAACHVVSPEQTRANPDAPSFTAVAEKYSGQDDSAALEAFLADPHPPMPDMSLTRQEIRDLIAYIASLQ